MYKVTSHLEYGEFCRHPAHRKIPTIKITNHLQLFPSPLHFPCPSLCLSPSVSAAVAVMQEAMQKLPAASVFLILSLSLSVSLPPFLSIKYKKNRMEKEREERERESERARESV